MWAIASKKIKFSLIFDFEQKDQGERHLSTHFLICWNVWMVVLVKKA